MRRVRTAAETVAEVKKKRERRRAARPPPLSLKEYSGKFVLKIPKSLHKRLEEKTKEENVSLNQETIYCITKGLQS
ncbi:MAG: toxin-antitoxin system HicB family antitoxin [Nitrospirae bacterium]|nr:toxin-antitoxin system HicB family antitoxin [Nitrospirota bacterium]MBF0591785.1 toxin-antitoxin system HicB family antitoxin [Nitrospirota bacterium]